MLLDLVDKLIDRCIALVKHQQEVQRNLLSDYLEPIYKELEIVHRSYLESFLKYRDIIKSSEQCFEPKHEIFDIIREDSLFSQGDREKLWTLAEFSKAPMTGGFITAVCGYLRFATKDTEYLVDDPYINSNMYRARLFTGLDQIFESNDTNEKKRSRAIEVLDDTTKLLQDKYASVLRAYSQTKDELLS
jgi:hypothetical protein